MHKYIHHIHFCHFIFLMSIITNFAWKKIQMKTDVTALKVCEKPQFWKPISTCAWTTFVTFCRARNDDGGFQFVV